MTLRDATPSLAGKLGYGCGYLFVVVPSWFFFTAAVAHAIYLIYPPLYYVNMHGGDEVAARWVSAFAIVFFYTCCDLWERWTINRLATINV